MTATRPAVFEIDLPGTAPPLSLNHRRNWRESAGLTRSIRQTVHVLAVQARIGRHGRVRVTLHYRPRDQRVRDIENPTPTLKACCDGIVDAGIVADDSPQFMVKDMPVIHPAARPARLWLIVAPIDAEENA
jgi:crossover junction endodeoxyribonuclease RusA